MEIVVGFTFWNDVLIYTDSFRKWDIPDGEIVSDLEFVKIKNRVARYFACWGGEIAFDDTELATLDDFKTQLQKDGIQYEELEGGVISYSNDIDAERRRPGGFFKK